MFLISNLARITAAGQSVAPAIWTYGTTDNFATASGSGYFNEIQYNLNIGDWIIIKASDSDLAVKVTATLPNVTVSVINNYNAALDNGNILIGNSSGVAVGANNILTAFQVGNVVSGNAVGYIPVIWYADMPGGSTNNIQFVMTENVVIDDVLVIVKGTGNAGDTVQVFTGAAGSTVLTNAISLSGASGSAANVLRPTDMASNARSVMPTQILEVVTTKGGSPANPQVTVIVTGHRVAS